MSKRKNGEGSWGVKKIGKYNYKYYRDADGSYTYGKTEKEINQKLKEKESIDFSLNTKTTFGEYISNWLLTKRNSIEESTYSGYENMIKGELLDFKGYDLANKQIKNLSDKVFREYLEALSKEYSRATITKMWSIIKQCVNYGEIKGELPNHTTKFVHIPSESSVKIKKKEIPFLSFEDTEKFYKASKETYNNGVPIFGVNAKAAVFIMYSGLRISEMIALKWENVDLKNKRITVSNAMGEKKNRENKGNKYIRYDKMPKTKDSIRIVPLPDRAIEIINWFDKNNPGHKNTDYVFINKNGDIINRRNMNRTIKAMAKKGNLTEQNFSAHSLRHTYGSLLLSKGVDIKIISELLGHKEIGITYNIYIGILEGDKQNEVERVFNKSKKRNSD